MLYTKKGDDGTTKTFGCDQRISKSTNIAETLGSLDEINSFLGLCKVQATYLGFKLGEIGLSEIVHNMQKNLFIVQAELAGAEKTIEERKVKELEEIIDEIVDSSSCFSGECTNSDLINIYSDDPMFTSSFSMMPVYIPFRVFVR